MISQQKTYFSTQTYVLQMGTLKNLINEMVLFLHTKAYVYTNGLQ